MRMTNEDVGVANALLHEHGPAQMYDFLISKGSRYSVLANGVARGEGYAGNVAIGFMKNVYSQKHESAMSDETLGQVRRVMAQSAIDAIKLNLELGEETWDVSIRQARDFHRDNFNNLGLGEESWTLHSVLKTIPEHEHQAFWETTLKQAGDFTGEMIIAGNTFKEIAARYSQACGSPS